MKSVSELRSPLIEVATVSPLATVFDPIPRATAFADAAMSLQPLAVYAPKHPGVQALNAIASGLEEN
ncbi:hypothetical protein [Leptolyngbya sp. CCY15150]|uniref:ParA family protein n=1 Tax=Leptolyngbya sp. CCY15150 TaxID=2767772 RepID=UPI00194DE3A9|nr:hypothetical protein [Leptolyngbya sp. CCY15150]